MAANVREGLRFLFHSFVWKNNLLVSMTFRMTFLLLLTVILITHVFGDCHIGIGFVQVIIKF